MKVTITLPLPYKGEKLQYYFRANILSRFQKPVSNCFGGQLFIIQVYMPTVQFAEAPHKSSISNNCCVHAIMVI